MKRRDFVRTATIAGCSATLNLSGFNPAKKILSRVIPSTGELLPSIGIGTWQSFNVGETKEERAPLREVLKKMIEYGGSVIDSSPMYGRSEKIVGVLTDELNINSKLFCATKVWTTGKDSGISQMNRSIDFMGKKPLDLMQVHNLQDWQTHIPTLLKWKEEGKIRYIGITHYVESAYTKMEKIMKEYPLDFIQLNYSMASRTAEKSILPLARDRGVAVLVNRPYEGGSLFRSTKNKVIPQWANELDITTWGQFFLKYLLANSTITCVIPGTSKPSHMLDNMAAGLGKLPNNKERQKMIAFLKG